MLFSGEISIGNSKNVKSIFVVPSGYTSLVAEKESIFICLSQQSYESIKMNTKMKSQNNIINLLSSIPIFSRFSKSQLIFKIFPKFEKLDFHKGEVLIWEGSEMKKIYVIKTGEFKSVIKANAATTKTNLNPKNSERIVKLIRFRYYSKVT